MNVFVNGKELKKEERQISIKEFPFIKASLPSLKKLSLETCGFNSLMEELSEIGKHLKRSIVYGICTEETKLL